MNKNLKRFNKLGKKLKNTRKVYSKFHSKYLNEQFKIDKAEKERFECFCDVLRDCAFELSRSQDDANKNIYFLHEIEELFSNCYGIRNYSVEQKPNQATIKFEVEHQKHEISSNDRKKESVEKENVR